ncbi:hypothetical protein C8D87_103169 [Lentzea atacamensis]|uniref:Uncharacterized protein n=1 Tax=Lentzea atacamensis TaxID=531938 RepID=A0ABX9E9J8_9PSEU|nr:hypothetical protein C8D87_103169 [Lentzea atacamensis]
MEHGRCGYRCVFDIIGTGVLLVGFVLWQRMNRRAPLLPLQVFDNRDFSAAACPRWPSGSS